MIRHIVLLKFKQDVPEKEINEILKALEGLKDVIPGILSFDSGPYSSHEGLNQGFTHGFTMDFKDAASRDGYLPHPDHEVLKGRIVAALDGGIDGVIAFDFEL